MKKSLLIVFLLSSIIAWPQSFNIRGNVVDIITKQPVAGAMVFIDQSTKGTITDSAGNFIITEVNETFFDIVLIANKYQLLIHSFTKEQINKKIRFEVSADTVITTSLKDTLPQKDIPKWQAIFLADLLGTSTNSDECYVANLSTLSFTIDSATHFVAVHAAEPLQIFNESLGYLITCKLDEFLMTANNGVVTSKYFTWFKELTTKRKEIITKWKTRRYDAFDGSLTHFFQTLCEGKIKERGFIIKKAQRFYADENTSNYAAAVKMNDAIINRDIVPTSYDAYRIRAFIEVVDKTAMAPEKIIVNDTATNSIILSSESRLQVMYAGKNGKYYYYQNGNNQLHGLNVVSDLILSKNIAIQKSGRYANVEDLDIQGYWHLLRLADQLPYDYTQSLRSL